MGWDRFDRRRNNKENVVAAYLSDDFWAPMPQLQVHTMLEDDPLIIMSIWSRQSSWGFRDEVLRDNQPSAGQIPPLARSRNGAESSLRDWFKSVGVCCRMPDGSEPLEPISLNGFFAPTICDWDIALR
jgi:hypothetical protein